MHKDRSLSVFIIPQEFWNTRGAAPGNKRVSSFVRIFSVQKTVAGYQAIGLMSQLLL
jgi:hypothetical protein